MGGDKHGSKSGRYVGGLLQLFDWNAKSRKKLFSSKSDSPGGATLADSLLTISRLFVVFNLFMTNSCIHFPLLSRTLKARKEK